MRRTVNAVLADAARFRSREDRPAAQAEEEAVPVTVAASEAPDRLRAGEAPGAPGLAVVQVHGVGRVGE